MKQKHLTLSDCIEIELGAVQDSSFKIITTKINQDSAFILKNKGLEILKHQHF